MSEVNVGRYVAIETAISVVANTVAGVVIAVAVFHGARVVPVAGVHGLVGDAVPQTFMGVCMSVLVPLLLTRRRRRQGRVGPALGGPERTVPRLVLTAALVAVPCTVVGVALVAAVLPQVAGASLDFGAMLRFKAAYGALIAATATPPALFAVLRPPAAPPDARVLTRA